MTALTQVPATGPTLVAWKIGIVTVKAFRIKSKMVYPDVFLRFLHPLQFLWIPLPFVREMQYTEMHGIGKVTVLSQAMENAAAQCEQLTLAIAEASISVVAVMAAMAVAQWKRASDHF